MAARSTVYSADEVTCMVGGLNIESGRGDDEFLKIEQQEDDFSYKAGIDGEGVFSQNKNTYTLVTITLLQTSAGNAILSGLHTASKLAGGLQVPVYVEDRKGSSMLISAAGMITKMPDEAWAKEAGVTVWTIGVHQPERIVGGH